MIKLMLKSPIGPVYACCAEACCDDASDPVLVENHGVTSEWVATHFGATTLLSIRRISLASSQHCRSVDANAQCK